MSNDLMQKLAISKKIMDKHNQTPRGTSSMGLPMTENTNVNYNIPNEALLENQQPEIKQINKEMSTDAIINSKLPDEIKRLMIENPIEQPKIGGPVLSDELIEGATRLMGTPKNNAKSQNQTVSENNDLRQMIRDVVRDTVRDVVKEELQNSGLLTESNKKTNEFLSLRVGSHIFEGKVLKK